MNRIRLVLADVDGTLVTKEKIVTRRAKDAVRELREAGIAFAITSGRPPRGMQMLIEPFAITTPIAAFNGGLFVSPDLSVIEQHVLQQDVVDQVIEIIKAHKLAVWIYRGIDWFVPERHAPHVDREEWTVKFSPTVVPDFAGKMNDVGKIVGVSDDLDVVAKCEAAVREQFASAVNSKQSNPQREPHSAVSAARSLGSCGLRVVARLCPQLFSTMEAHFQNGVSIVNSG
ncbi:MAG: HAD-IIB family hydrolase, partial [Chthoniobacterales bacterium]